MNLLFIIYIYIYMICDLENVQNMICDLDNVENMICDLENVQNMICDLDNVQNMICDLDNVQNMICDLENVQNMICDLDNVQNMICDLDNVQNIIREEGLELLVVSYGGCCSNTLVDALMRNNYKCITNIWCSILCHCPKYIEIDIPIIYVYDNPIKSFMSMKNRGDGHWGVNQQKMSNDLNVVLSDENLIQLMIKQFNSWTNVKRDNVLVIKSCELFEDGIVNKLEHFLKKKIDNFPIIYNQPKTNINNINDEILIELFEKYKSEIDKILNFPN